MQGRYAWGDSMTLIMPVAATSTVIALCLLVYKSLSQEK
jgi:hypothetical protein